MFYEYWNSQKSILSIYIITKVYVHSVSSDLSSDLRVYFVLPILSGLEIVSMNS